MRNKIIEIVVLLMIVGSFLFGLFLGKMVGRTEGAAELWEFQKRLFGLSDNTAIKLPNGAILYSDGRIAMVDPKLKEIRETTKEDECQHCHQGLK